MFEYYYSLLPETGKKMYRAMVQAALRGETEATVQPCLADSDLLSSMLNAVRKDHPELYLVKYDSLRSTVYEYEKKLILHIGYIAGEARRRQIAAQIDKQIDGVVALGKKAGLKTTFDVCCWAHDWLVKNVRYNDAAMGDSDGHPDAYSVIGVFRDKLAVCAGISSAFKLLCDRLGAKALVVSGTSTLKDIRYSGPHGWNMVCVDGVYSHVDVTWDMCESVASQFTRYDYFCLPDECMRSDHAFDRTYPRCATKEMSFFRKRSRWFTNEKELASYLESELRGGAKVLYFRADSGRLTGDAFIDKINDQVRQAIRASANRAFSYVMIHNKEQNCFFFKIDRK